MTRSLLASSMLALLVALATSSASAQPAVVPVQGLVLNEVGEPVTNGPVGLTIRIYDDPLNGVVLHQEVVSTTTRHGQFSHLLGTNTPLDLTVFDGGARWVAVQLATDAAEMTPRQPVGHVANAVFAGSAASVPWGGVTGVPPNVANAGGYTSGLGVAVDSAARTFGLAACGTGQTWVRTPSGWSCESILANVTAGEGILVNGPEISVNTAVMQRRFNAHDCPFGVQTFGADGTVTCAPNNNTDTNVFGRLCTAAGTVLRGYDASGNPLCVVDQNTNVFGQACTNAGEILRGFDAVGAPICFTSTFVDTNVFGRQCAIAGQVVRSFDAAGTPVCVNDRDTNTNVFGQECAIGQHLRGFQAGGTPICVNDRDTNTTYIPGSGVRLVGTDFRISSTALTRSACGWRSCGNGGDCPCNNDEFLGGWQDANSTDWSYCCQLWLND